MSQIARRYVLLDASVIIPYYLPEAGKHKKVPDRIHTLMESVRKRLANHVFLYVPNICIGEVFDTLNKFCWAKWNPNVRRIFRGGLNTKTYRRVCDQFRKDIHNGQLMHQYELCRYHLLALDLVSPVDHYFQHCRDRGKKKQKTPMGTADVLIAAMAIWLVRVHGWEQFALVTADHRMSDILTKVSPTVAKSTAAKLGLPSRASELGFQYEPRMYPRVLNLARTTDQDLADFFGEWPLPTRRKWRTTGAS